MISGCKLKRWVFWLWKELIWETMFPAHMENTGPIFCCWSNGTAYWRLCDGAWNIVALHFRKCELEFCRFEDGICARRKKNGAERVQTINNSDGVKKEDAIDLEETCSCRICTSLSSSWNIKSHCIFMWRELWTVSSPPNEIDALLKNYEDLFKEPKELLPPTDGCRAYAIINFYLQKYINE